MKEKFKKGYIIFFKFYMHFFVAAVVGWVYEVLTIMLENHHGFQNRGVLLGPYLPVYGFGIGGTILLYLIQPLIDKFTRKETTFVIVGSIFLVVFLVDAFIALG
ncbi:MAG: hypothetical protein PUE81_05310 [Lachnospiraceae bacterium]|nr:hypothetical protein [Lachnospiraceae bacterium]